jgi:hypothetical protein
LVQQGGRDEPSEVLTSMGLAPEDALCALGISLNRWTTTTTTTRDIDEAGAHIAAAARNVPG